MTRNSIILVTSIACCIIGCAGISSALYARNRDSTVPAAAAAEARLVCEPFGGLEHFEVERAPAKHGDVTTYRVSSTCQSQHVVSGVINLQRAAAPASAPQ